MEVAPPTKRRRSSRENEAKLAEALEAFIDPLHPDFDPVFTREIFALRPDWFTDAERERVRPYLTTH